MVCGTVSLCGQKNAVDARRSTLLFSSDLGYSCFYSVLWQRGTTLLRHILVVRSAQGISGIPLQLLGAGHGSRVLQLPHRRAPDICALDTYSGDTEGSREDFGGRPLESLPHRYTPLAFTWDCSGGGAYLLILFFSFTTVLVFGGKVGTTIEVEIYYALHYQSNYALVLVLSMVETMCALLGILLLTRTQGRTQRTLRDFGRTQELRSPKGLQRLFIVIYGIFIVFFSMVHSCPLQ